MESYSLYYPKNNAGKKDSCLTSQSPDCTMVLDGEEEAVEVVVLKEKEEEVEQHAVRKRLRTLG